MPKFIECARANLLREGDRLRAFARSQVEDLNASYLLVHNVLAEALRSDAAAETNGALLDAALQEEIDRFFGCRPHARAAA